jgi:hypothetical protein
LDPVSEATRSRLDRRSCEATQAWSRARRWRSSRSGRTSRSSSVRARAPFRVHAESADADRAASNATAEAEELARGKDNVKVVSLDVADAEAVERLVAQSDVVIRWGPRGGSNLGVLMASQSVAGRVSPDSGSALREESEAHGHRVVYLAGDGGSRQEVRYNTPDKHPCAHGRPAPRRPMFSC